jgi:hypothetical protein
MNATEWRAHWAWVDRWIDETFASQAQTTEDIVKVRVAIGLMKELAEKYPKIIVGKHVKP